MTDLKHNVPRSFTKEVKNLCGLNAAACYQCGKCSAGCPMGREMELGPHDIMRLVQQNRRQELLEDNAIWFCAACETCSQRCPNEVDPARIIDCVRELAIQADPSQVPRRVRAFHSAFLKQIVKHGRIFEFGLVASYKMKSGALFDDLGIVPGMLVRGKLSMVPHGIKNKDEIVRIFMACQEHDNTDPGETS